MTAQYDWIEDALRMMGPEAHEVLAASGDTVFDRVPRPLLEDERRLLWKQARVLNFIAGQDERESDLSDLMMDVAYGLQRALAVLEGKSVGRKPTMPQPDEPEMHPKRVKVRDGAPPMKQGT